LSHFQRLHWKEHRTILFGLPSFQDRYLLTVKLSNKRDIDSFIVKFYFRLSKISKAHLVCSTGYHANHFHSIISATKPITADMVAKSIEKHPQRSQLSKKPDAIHFVPFTPDPEGRGWRYCNTKHTPFSTSLFHPRSRCNKATCMFRKEFDAASKHILLPFGDLRPL
jgi:hypothetical protein